MTRPVYLTATGAFLPGPPVANDEIEDVLGLVAGQPSKFKKFVLGSNGIESRHYARNKEGKQTHLNEDLATFAVEAALKDRGYQASDAGMLSFGTAVPDLLVPGFSSMVHGRIGGHPMEILTSTGACVCGMNAFRAAYNGVRTGDHRVAITGASELASAMLTGIRFDKESEVKRPRGDKEDSYQYFNADFLRWMLSDGAGAAILEADPHPDRVSLRVDWVTSRSYAHDYGLCMYAGTSNPRAPAVGNTIYSYPTVADAERDGLIMLRQDTKLLAKGMPDVAGRELRRVLIEQQVDMHAIDWVLPHMSSYVFYDEIRGVVSEYGIGEDRLFTNLKTKGNTGSASIYIMLDDALRQGLFKPGQRIFLMVPESGRFSISYAMLTCVGPQASSTVLTPSTRTGNTANKEGDKPMPATRTIEPNNVSPNASRKHERTEERTAAVLERSPLGPAIANSVNPVTKYLAVELAYVWDEFSERLRATAFGQALENGTFTVEDYRCLLRNLRQQVIDGGRWISRAASNVSQDIFFLRSSMIEHAYEEHKDFQLLEKDFVAAGGDRAEIENTPKNVGSEAFSGYVFQCASKPNPFGLLGGMFIIEGLGQHFAGGWAKRIREILDLPEEAVSFLAYHGENDDNHYNKLRMILSLPLITPEIAEEIVTTAKTVARLYVLQIEELDNV